MQLYHQYVVSRYIDDKAAVAALIEMMAYFKRNNLKPKYRTLLAFPIYEEIGHGGAYVPEEVEPGHFCACHLYDKK